VVAGDVVGLSEGLLVGFHIGESTPFLGVVHKNNHIGNALGPAVVEGEHFFHPQLGVFPGSLVLSFQVDVGVDLDQED
jgi:hypothetical protein